MSHFQTFVIGEDIDGQLAAYSENLAVKPYKVHFTTDEIEEARTYYAKENAVYKDDESMMHAWTGETIVDRDEQGLFRWSTYNKDAKWDYYVIGGRWSNSLRLFTGKYVNSAKRRDIDFDGEREKQEREFGEHYDKWQAIVDAHGMPESWDAVLARHQENDKPEVMRARDTELDKARDAYHAQAALVAVRDSGLVHWLSGDAPTYFAGTRDEFSKRMALQATMPFAMVYEGAWHAKGRMGWFGVSSDENPEWKAQAWDAMTKLPPDMLITVVDCHI